MNAAMLVLGSRPNSARAAGLNGVKAAEFWGDSKYSSATLTPSQGFPSITGAHCCRPVKAAVPTSEMRSRQ